MTPTPDRPECSGDPAREGHAPGCGRPSGDAAEGVLSTSDRGTKANPAGDVDLDRLFSSPPPKPAPDAMRLTDRELYDNSCITRHQLATWVDSDYAAHIVGLKHTIEFLLTRLDSCSAPSPDGPTGIEAAKLIEDYIRLRDSLDEDDCANIIHILHEAGVRFGSPSATGAAEPDAVRLALENVERHLAFQHKWLYEQFDAMGRTRDEGSASADTWHQIEATYAVWKEIKAALRRTAAPIPTPGLTIAQMERAAKACRDKYCELMSGEKAWVDLTRDERGMLMVSLSAAFSAVSVAPAVGVTREAIAKLQEVVDLDSHGRYGRLAREAIAALSAPDATVSADESRLITETDREYASELLADLTNGDLPRLEIAARWFRKARVELSLRKSAGPVVTKGVAT